MSRLINMVPPLYQRKVVGSTFNAKAIPRMDEAECQRLYGSQKKVKIVEGVVVNFDQNILIKGVSTSMLLLTKKILMEVLRAPGYILSLWLQDQL